MKKLSITLLLIIICCALCGCIGSLSLENDKTAELTLSQLDNNLESYNDNSDINSLPLAAESRSSSFDSIMTSYIGKTYYFLSAIKIYFEDGNSFTNNNTTYSAATSFRVVWLTVGRNFNWSHNMEIKKFSINLLKGSSSLANYTTPQGKNADYYPKEEEREYPIYSGSAEGVYTIKYDIEYESWGTTVRYKDSYKFSIDRTDPKLTLKTSDGNELVWSTTNKSVVVSWNDNSPVTVSAQRNGTTISCPLNSTMSEEGNYIIEVTDYAKNKSQASFTIDKTRPDWSNIKINNNNITQKEIWTNIPLTLSFDKNKDSSFSNLIVNNYGYHSGYIDSNGDYRIQAKDFANNLSDVVIIHWSNTLPTGRLNGVTNGGTTNSNVSFDAITSDVSIKLDNAHYTSGNPITTPGNHTIVITDRYGNSNTYTFTIDRTPPSYNVSGVTNDGKTNKNVSITWTEAGATATLNGVAYTSGSLITAEGNYIFTIKDPVGNSTSFNFTIDKTPPTFTLEGTTNGGRTKSSVKLTWDEVGATATINDEPYTKGTTIADEGFYTIILSDSLGNKTNITFEIDKTPPTFTLEGVMQGGRTNQDVKLSWSEVGATASMDGHSISNPSVFTNDGLYKIILSDTLGNKSTIQFEIDKTPPTFTLEGVSNGGRTKSSVRLRWSESSATATINGSPYTNGDTIRDENSYTIVLSDTLGNKTTVTFEIDKTPPTFTLEGVEQGGCTNQDVKLSWSEASAMASMDGNSISNPSVFTNDGLYEITLSDDVGNKVVVNFTIDKTPPSYTLIGVEQGGYTNKNVSLRWSESSAYATINGSPYANGETINNEGEYSINLYDAIGNMVLITFTIDKTPPAYSFSSTPTNFKNNTYYFNTDIFIRYNEIGAYAKINNDTYNSGDIISCNNGSIVNAEVLIYDFLGNFATVNICISKKKYTNNYDYFYDKYKASQPTWWETYDYTLLNNKYQQNNRYSFTSRDDIIAFALQREQGIVEYHSEFQGGNSIFCDYANRYVDSIDVTNLTQMIGMPYRIYKSIDNANNLTAYFDMAKLQQAINFYMQSSLTQKYLPSKPASPFPGLADISVQPIYRNELYARANEVEFPYKPNDIVLKVNGRLADYNTVRLTEGSNFIEETDFAGNVTTYIIVVDPKPPKVNAYDFGGGLHEDLTSWFIDRTNIYVSHQFRINVYDSYDDLPIFTVKKDGELTYVLDGYYDFTDAGAYELTTYDVAGNQQTYTINVSLIPPTINTSDVVENYKIIAFNLDISFQYKFENLNKITVDLYNSELGTWSTLLRDDNNLLIDNGNLNYYFFTNGIYKITLIDNFGRETIKEVEFAKDSPQGHLFNDKNLEVPSGTSTNKKVYFTWEESSCFATLNGNTYIKNTFISDEGSYTIRLEDRAGNYSIYNFEIDKTAPIGSFEGVTNGGTTNKNVSFTWSENEHATAQIKRTTDEQFFDYVNGALIVDDGIYTIILTDIAGNEKTYSFRIKKYAPAVSIFTSSTMELKNGATTRENFYFSWSESSVTATLNGKLYTNKSVIKTAGNHVFIISDNVGNTAYYNIILDNVPPTFTLNGVEQGGRTNNDVSLTWDEIGATATIDKIAYTSGAIIDLEGLHQFILSDALGNQVVIDFEIDKTPPSYTLVGVSLGGITNQNVKLSWSESSATATLNGSNYTSGSYIAAEGNHEIILTDRIGNSVVIDFEIDKTPPTFTVNDGNDTIKYTNQDITLSWEEEHLSASLNGVPYTKNSIITVDNDYTFILADRAGNRISYSFQIRKTLAQYTLTGVKENGYSNSPVKFSWTESGAIAILNDSLYSSDTWINQEGEHSIVFTDRYGNSKNIKFIIDKTMPIVNLIGVVNKGKTNQAVTITWLDSSYVVSVNDNIINNGAVIDISPNTEEYFIVVVKSLSNVTNSFEFTIDKISPEGILTGVTNGGRTNTNVNLKWSESSTTATLNGENYSSGSWISADGIYEIVLSDIAGNSTYYNFSISRSAPKYIINGAEEDGITNHDVTISWYDDDITAYLDNEIYNMNDLISAEGNHSVLLINSIGNNVTFNFTIDKTPPEFVLSGVTNGGKTCNTVNISWNESNVTVYLNDNIISLTSTLEISLDGDYYFEIIDLAGNSNSATFHINTEDIYVNIIGLNENNRSNNEVSISWFFCESLATLNGITYTSDDIISDEGFYTFIINNEYGKSYTLNFEIDKTPPTFTLDGVSRNGFTSNDVRIMYNDKYAFARYTSGVEYVSGSWITDSGNYNIILSDDLGNMEIISFSINKEAPIYSFVGVYNGRTNEDVTIRCEDPSVISILVNNNPYDIGTIISDEGFYDVTFINNVGLRFNDSFEIDKTAPTFTLEGVEQGGRTNNNVSLKWSEKNVTSYIIISEDNYIEYYSTELHTEGFYKIIILDDLGNSVYVEFEIDKTAPTFTLEGVEQGGRTNNDVSLTWDEVGATATIDKIAYTSGAIIDVEGNHQLILSDDLGNSVVIDFEIDKTAPTFTLEGVEQGGRTNKNVSISWTESSATAALNGSPYTLKYPIRTEGDYIFIISDKLGNSTSCNFTIDKTPPKYEITGVSNGGYTNSPVSVFWSKIGASATLNGVSYSSGEVVNQDGIYNLILSDDIGNSTAINFEINTQSPDYETNLKGDKTNKPIYFSWQSALTTATLNGNKYNNKETISSDGDYVIIITNKYGNSITINFTIKRKQDNVFIESPNLEEPYQIVHGKSYTIYNSATLTANGQGSLYVNDVAVPLGTELNEVGTYKIKYIDDYGNINEITLTITAPKEDISVNNSILGLISFGVVAIVITIIILILHAYRSKSKFHIRKKQS